MNRYTQSGNTLRHKTGALRKALGRYVDVVYPTGPVVLESPDSADLEERRRLDSLGNEASEGSYAWWRADDVKQEFLEMDKTMSMMKDILEKEGPFDGVLGFSQGGGLAGVLTALLERPGNTLLNTTHPPFKFAVIFSGFKARFPQYAWLYEPPIQTPMLHVIGRNDPIVTPDRSSELVAANPTGKVLEHPGSHFVPSAARYRNEVVDFVVAHVKPRRKMTCIVAATDKGLGIGKDGGLPWRLKKEMAYFAKVTQAAAEERQNVVIMGRNSWESIPKKFRPLKGRINIVVTSNEQYDLGADDNNAIKSQRTTLATSLDDALVKVEREFAQVADKIFVIGGAQLYRTALAHPDTERILFTSIGKEFDCDIAFPVDFRQKDASWNQRPYAELHEWADIASADMPPETEQEGDVTWQYQVWEKVDRPQADEQEQNGGAQSPPKL